MEARKILLTSLVFALWSATTTEQMLFCTNLVDGPYCETCFQPVDCLDGVYTAYPLCAAGMACTVGFGAAYCVPHTQTKCACAGTGPQCDAYNFGYIEHCDASGPFRVDPCPWNTPTCYNDECVAYPTCTHNAWNVSPDCTGAYYCDANGIIINEVDCHDGEYMNSGFDCVPGPLPACDGSCTGKCPNPTDCTTFFVCDGATMVSLVSCPPNSHFDIVSNTCISAGYTCTLLDGCDLEIITVTPGTGDTTTPSTGTTTPTTTTTTTDGSIVTPPPPETCNSSTVNSKLPYANCSQLYWSCQVEVAGQYKYVKYQCIGDLYFDTDPSNPYCTYPAEIATCH